MTNLLVIGLLATFDQDKEKYLEFIRNIIENEYEIECKIIDLKKIFQNLKTNLNSDNDNEKIKNTLCNKIKSVSELEEIFVISSIKLMKEDLKRNNSSKPIVYLIEFLKSKQEVDLFRQLFGLNFFLFKHVHFNFT